MRIKELYETSPTAQGIYDKNQDRQNGSSNRIPRLTLRNLNRLKHIRNARKKAHKEKLEFLPKIYGNEDHLAARQQLEQDRLELIKDEIALEIEAAKISHDQKDHIADMAMRAIERNRKA